MSERGSMSEFVGGVIGFFVSGFLAFYLFVFIVAAVFGSSPISDMMTSSFLVVLVGPVIALVAAIMGAAAGHKHALLQREGQTASRQRGVLHHRSRP
jgi:ABC-type multidrug transport system permease subunit